MEEIELLIEDYQRRLETISRLPENEITERIKVKASCYRTFVAELKVARANLLNNNNQ